MENFINESRLAFNSLSLYSSILQDTTIKKLYKLIESISCGLFELNQSVRLYNDFFYSLKEFEPSITLKEYIVQKLVYDENPFSRSAETNELQYVPSSIKNAAINDLDYLQLISEISSVMIKSHMLAVCSTSDFERGIIESLPVWELEECTHDPFGLHLGESREIISAFVQSHSWSSLIERLSQFHKSCGTGIYAKYKAFVWEHSASGFLKGVVTPDPIVFSDMIGYTLEREEVINNTLQFLKGYNANNMLLYGDRGTGKSSTVKAVLNEYYSKGLRLIEVSKSHLVYFPELINDLKDRCQKFIIFVDDLAFEDNEENYTALKAALEGGIESRPHNVLIYATSNRRHLIKEKFSDRLGLKSSDHDDEIRAADSIQEKLSLADRFGITVIFSSPDKNKYLEIVEGIALKRGLKVDKEYLHNEAMKWEMWYNGRSPRTAKQFVDWLEGQQA